MNIESGAHVVATGAPHFVMEAGSFENNGSYHDDAGTFKASGGIIFTGSGTTQLYKLVVDNADHSLMNSLISVYDLTTLLSGSLDANAKLHVRSDVSPTARMEVTGVLTNDVIGIITRSTEPIGTCPSYTTDLSLNISGPAMVYQWQTSLDNVSWTDVPGATSATYTATITGNCYYRCYTTTNNSSYGQATSVVFQEFINSAAPISAPPSVCVGRTEVLSNPVPGGTWSSSTPAVGSISATGVVRGLSAGTTTIVYTNPYGCSSSAVMEVLAPPASITGTLSVNIEATTTLSSTTPDGLWSSSNEDVALADAMTGVVTGVSAGTANITYSMVTGCYTTAVVTVNNTTPITGASAVCAGSSITLSNATSGGTWSSLSSNVTVNASTGMVTGVTAGSATITYTAPAGWAVTAPIMVNALPEAITGTLSICAGTNTTLTSATAGQTWSSANEAIATVATGTPTTGIVTGLAAGSVNISYTNAAGCSRYATVTVNAIPAPISGSSEVCTGNTATYTSSGSGTWSSSAPAVGSISAGGVLTALSYGMTTVVYTNAASCTASKLVLVNESPAPITGTLLVNIAATTSLNSTTTGGTWFSSNTDVATVNTTGVVTGLTGGTATITYKKLTTGCYTTAIVTVNNSTPITGPSSVCVGSTITLGNATTGGTWSSPSSNVTVNASTGVVAGLASGTATVSYTAPTGWVVTTPIAVNAAPGTIGGTLSVCVGATTTLNSATAGQTWSSANETIATVATGTSTTGIVTGVAPGSVDISYTNAAGCSRYATVIVSETPAAIEGSNTVCVGSNTLYTNTTPGGTWVSSVTTYGTISAGGVLSGLSAGNTTLSYNMPGGCRTIKVVSVSAAPAAIGGTLSACVGTTTTLNSATAGQTWSSSNEAVATVVSSGSSTAIVTGVAAGTASISYANAAGCARVVTVTINSSPDPISGSNAICVGDVSSYTCATPGGTWSSSAGAVGTVSVDGALRGIAAGSLTLSYNMAGSCRSTKVVSVNAVPGAISGTLSVCEGANTTLGNATSGLTWSSADDSKATVVTASGLTGTVTGVSAGTVDISYTTAGGCASVVNVTVNTTPAAITGSNTACVGLPSNYANATPGGTWVSSNTAAGTITAAGVLTGVASGNTTLSYNMPGGCRATKVVTVNITPNGITGTLSVCIGATTTLTSTTAGQTWSTADGGIATVTTGTTTTGIVTGISAGAVNISYTNASGCYSYATVVVNAVPSTVTGSNSVCIGNTAMYTNTTSGGTWVSSTASVGTITTGGGALTGVAAGTTTVSYVAPGGCVSTKVVSVVAAPAAITGTLAACTSLTTTLTSTTAGQTWSSADETIATVATGTSTTGVVTGVAPGTVNISYTNASGCVRMVNVTINSSPAAISGPTGVCLGSTATYTNTTPGGTWSSSTGAVGTITPGGGVLSTFNAGSTTIYYNIPGGCRAAQVVSVNTAPAAITGTTGLCVNNTTSLGSTTASQIWSSGDATVATVVASGANNAVVTGVAPGTAVISYAFSGGCARTTTVVVSPAVLPIVGDNLVCISGGTVTLSNATGGGTWISSVTSRATINSTTGAITALTAGTTVITYRISNTCFNTTIVTVNAAMATTTGPTAVCVGSDITLANTTTGGTWTSSNASLGSVDAGTGVVRGVANGTVNITYALSTGCVRTKPVTINAVPASITGSLNLTVGQTSTLGCATTGGTWLSSSSGIASIGSSTGVMTAVSAGAATITYRLTATGCFSTAPASISTLRPAVIGGPSIAHIKIYPNPTSRYVSIEAPVNGTFVVYAMDGKRVGVYNVVTPVTAISLPGDLAAGMYTCRFEGEDGSNSMITLVYTPQ
ncbi:hypothetical protein GCM10023093_20420 [Nemorincola caseinilytica]|uniref:BIG2 domain-containing protein n=2 Tax=Nemorincola caseinilytica TaxID=2054315 RepID=A0ABP8NJG5_9BACT